MHDATLFAALARYLGTVRLLLTEMFIRYTSAASFAIKNPIFVRHISVAKVTVTSSTARNLADNLNLLFFIGFILNIFLHSEYLFLFSVLNRIWFFAVQVFMIFLLSFGLIIDRAENGIHFWLADNHLNGIL